ncbi:hypothetical protein [Enhygromyxa salina]|uniref:Uncharacterized protein n=1 Tax=Enhygromyxa salina TaxID=215803 RepID=A0A2S9YRS6_9BACT|nr:hypothetical protein [Enhygromyxa salina]PRQ07803.1 hypothetical protein ENSA7_24750 [Enhygromyxa salina]
MPATSVEDLLNQTATDLEQLRDQYAGLARELERKNISELHARAKAQFVELLVSREDQTIAALRGYLDADEPHAELDVHVRLGGEFPQTADDLRLPAKPSIDDLVQIAERTDERLALLSERIKIYTLSGGLFQALAAFETLVVNRQRQLAAAVRELDQDMPTPT